MHHERPLVVSGDMEGKMFFANYQTGEIGGMIGEHADTVESITMSRTLPVCVSAGIDTKINIYDLNTMQIRTSITANEYGGYTKVQFSQLNPNILYAASTLGEFNLIDVRDGKLVKVYKGHAAPINDFVEVKEHNLIVTAGDDRCCLVFDLTQQ